VLHKVGRTKEHFSQSLIDFIIGDTKTFIHHQGPEKLLNLFFLFPYVKHQVIVEQDNIDLLPESIKLEGRIGELLQVVYNICSFGVLVDISNTCEIVFIGIDDAGPVSITPEVPGSSDMFIVPDCDPGVEVLHGAMQVFFGSCCDDVIVVPH